MVYIDGANGTRHVGDHTSRYQGSDLVLIGSNIPHLNFDHGVKTNYEKVVLQIQPAFKQQVLGTVPELSTIDDLFNESQYGIAFTGKTKEAIGLRLKHFHQLPAFRQFLEAIDIFRELSLSKEKKLLHDVPYINQYSVKEQQRLREIYVFIDQHYQRKIEVDEVAALCNLSKAAFCRYFKKAAGNTFINFLNQYRISQAKRLLLVGKNVSETCYACGFESLSYFNRTFKRISGENPMAFKQRHVRGRV